MKSIRSGLFTSSIHKPNNLFNIAKQFFRQFNAEKKYFPHGIGLKKNQDRQHKSSLDYNPETPFRQQDYTELLSIQDKYQYDKRYLRVMNDWRENLQRKDIKKRRSHELLSNYAFPESQEEKFVVHDISKQIELPPKDSDLFAVVSFKGLQHKVVKNDTLMLEKVPLEVGQTFIFDKVMLVGSPSYTSVGRPYVSTAKVLACVEQQTLTENVIIFKKRRRKGYQKNQGHRQEVTMVRILKVLHNPSQDSIDNYSKL